MLKKLLMIAAIVATVLLSACGVSVEDSGSGKDREEKQPKATQEVKQDNDDKQSGKNNDPGTDVNPGNTDNGNGNTNNDNGNVNNDNGNNNDGENNGQDDPYQGDNGNNNGNNNENNEYAGAKAEIMLYKLDDNTLVVDVKGVMCADVKAKPGSDRGESEFYLSMNNGETRMEMISGEFHGWSGEGDNTVYFSANPEYHNGIVVACEDRYYCVMKEDNLWNRVNFAGDYVLKFGRTYAAEYEGFEVAKGKVSDIIGTIDEETNNALFAEAMKSMKADDPADPAWSGGYMMGYSYDGKTGYVDVEVLDGGLLLFHIVTNDADKLYYAKQTEFDKAEYSYGSFIKSTAEAILLGSYNKHADFTLRTDPDKPTELQVNISEYADDNERYYLDQTFSGFVPWHQQPSDYSDADIYDLIPVAGLSSDPVFTPATDNYVLAVREKYSVYIDNDRSVTSKYASLMSFDENDFMRQRVEQYIFDNNSDAEAFYQKVLNYGYKNNPYKKIGNSVYYTYEADYSIYNATKANSVMNYVGYDNLSYDCHYMYKESQYDGRCTVYLNKPLNSDDFKVGLKDAVLWKRLYGHPYHSKDYKGAELRVYIDTYGESISIEGQTGSQEEPYRNFQSMSNVRLDGNRVKAATFSYAWDYKTDKYTYCMVYRDVVFSETEAIVTDYWFNIGDNLDHGITFDNFKEKQASFTISQTFDLTRTAD
ncbi:MAG: hypothetical protein IKS11_04020 [Lachnospiraceae bacterium]|nr:hypothetical protein [Lachnospiraceae bacterium]